MIDAFGDTLVLELREPIEIGGVVTTSLTLTEPTGEQLAAAHRLTLPIEVLMTLVAQNTGVSPAIVKKMRQRDLQRADDFFAHFSTPTSPANSESSPQS